MLSKPAAMHIPDGFLTTLVAIGLWALSIIFVAIALKKVNRTLGERQVPLMGVLAACIFAGQMLNFAVAGGTSGHLMGAAIATILLGPWASIVILTCVLGAQALLFQDGGLLALGANIFNMGVIGSFVAYFAYGAVRKVAGARPWGIFAGGFAAGWLSIVVAALAVALELAFSGTTPANLAIPAMGGVHALIGIGEGLITVGALSLIYAARRDLLDAGSSDGRSHRGVLVAGGVIAILLAVASPLASTDPDGLEAVAEQLGFLSRAAAPSFEIIPDYVFPGLPGEALATIAAGILGTLLVLGVSLAIGYSRRKREPRKTAQP